MYTVVVVEAIVFAVNTSHPITGSRCHVRITSLAVVVIVRTCDGQGPQPPIAPRTVVVKVHRDSLRLRGNTTLSQGLAPAVALSLLHGLLAIDRCAYAEQSTIVTVFSPHTWSRAVALSAASGVPSDCIATSPCRVPHVVDWCFSVTGGSVGVGMRQRRLTICRSSCR